MFVSESQGNPVQDTIHQQIYTDCCCMHMGQLRPSPSPWNSLYSLQEKNHMREYQMCIYIKEELKEYTAMPFVRNTRYCFPSKGNHGLNNSRQKVFTLPLFPKISVLLYPQITRFQLFHREQKIIILQSPASSYRNQIPKRVVCQGQH